MRCPKCQHDNQGGNFCEQCGAALTLTPAFEEGGAVSQTRVAPQNQYFEGAKNVSKTYFSYFLQVIKKPYASSAGVGSEHFTNGMITLALYAVLVPLILYFVLKGMLTDINAFGGFFSEKSVDLSMTDIVLKPILAYGVFIMLVATFTFAAVKMGGSFASYKEVIARFGSFQIPFVAVLAISLVMSILKVDLFFFFLFVGFIGSVFLVPPLVIASFKKDLHAGFDVLYGSLLTYLLTFVAIWIMGDMLFEAMKSYVMNAFNMFDF